MRWYANVLFYISTKVAVTLLAHRLLRILYVDRNNVFAEEAFYYLNCFPL